MVQFTKIEGKNQLLITHSYNFSLNTLWNYFTNEHEIVKWFAPKPYLAISQKMNFTNGGNWLYYMQSLEGEKHWCMSKYYSIIPFKSYEVIDMFCNEHGIVNETFPQTHWLNTFEENKGITIITNVLTFKTAYELSKLLEMGFEEGYTIALNQLQELLSNN